MHFIKDKGSRPAARRGGDATREVHAQRRRIPRQAGWRQAQQCTTLAAWAARDAIAQTAAPGQAAATARCPERRRAARLTMEKLEHPTADVCSYNNFYEFGTDKADPAKNWPVA